MQVTNWIHKTLTLTVLTLQLTDQEDSDPASEGKPDSSKEGPETSTGI